jgi:ribose 5-phosphate isomerase A
MTIIERALELVPNGSRIGLGSGRAAQAFVKALGERVRRGSLHVYGVPASQQTEDLAMQEDVPLLTLDQVGTLDLTVDGADEVDPNLDLIKGYGRALVREKIVAASSRRLIILVGDEKLVPRLGSRGKLPVEVTPFALPLCERRLSELGCRPVLYLLRNGSPFVTDNGNHILDCQIDPITDAAQLECDIRAIPGVVGTGLFLGMADIVLVGDRSDFRMLEEKQRGERSNGLARNADHEPVQQTESSGTECVRARADNVRGRLSVMVGAVGSPWKALR